MAVRKGGASRGSGPRASVVATSRCEEAWCYVDESLPQSANMGRHFERQRYTGVGTSFQDIIELLEDEAPPHRIEWGATIP